MTNTASLDSEDLVKLALASRGKGALFDSAAEFDDDDDEMWEFDNDDDEDSHHDEDSWEFDDDDDDEDFDDDDEMLEFDDDDDEGFDGEADMSERRRRRRRRRRRSFSRPRFKRFTRKRRRVTRAKGSRTTTLKAKNGQRMRVRFGKSFATTAEVNKLIKSTESRFAAAMKERRANHDALSKRIASATRNLDGKVATMRKNIKALEKQSQTSMLLGMLQGPPKVETLRLTGDDAGALKDKDIAADVTFKKSDSLLPLMMMGGLGGSSGSGGSDDMLTFALLMSNRN